MFFDEEPETGETPEQTPEEQPKEENEKGKDSPLDQITETGSITQTNGKYVIHCLTVVGQIEGHYILPPQNKTTKYEHVIPQLVAIEEDPRIDGLLVILNTVGGDVEAGLAIAELIAGMKKPTVSLVLGGGHSIGVPLAVSAKMSYIVPSATMTIHPVRMNGLVLGIPQTMSYFDRMQERIIKFVSDNSGITGKRFRQMMMNTGELVMDVGTVLDGESAVREGLIDRLGGLSDALECLYELIERHKGDLDQEKKKSGRKGRKPEDGGKPAPSDEGSQKKKPEKKETDEEKEKKEPSTDADRADPGRRSRGRPRKTEEEER